MDQNETIVYRNDDCWGPDAIPKYGAAKFYGKGLLYEYTQILLGESTSFSSSYFGSHSVDNKGFAEFIFRQAIEVFLHWTPQEAQVKMNDRIVKEMKLEKALRYMDLPPEIERSRDYAMIVALLYPNELHINQEQLVIDTYESVLKGQENGGLYKFPKYYFDGLTGRMRGHICMRYLLEHKCSFHSSREMYEFFSTEAGTSLLNSNALKVVLRDVFHSPVLFLHESLPASLQDEYWYHYYEFQYRYRKELTSLQTWMKKSNGRTSISLQSATRP